VIRFGVSSGGSQDRCHPVHRPRSLDEPKIGDLREVIQTVAVSFLCDFYAHFPLGPGYLEDHIYPDHECCYRPTPMPSVRDQDKCGLLGTRAEWKVSIKITEEWDWDR